MADWNMGVYRPFPRGQYRSDVEYHYLDIVTYEGSSYICKNVDTIDDVSCIGIAPSGQAESVNYWQQIASRGEKGEMADSYLPYLELTNNIWDYSLGDKVYVPEDANIDALSIVNVYDGCCGIIISKKDLVLPKNSYFDLSYNYVNRVYDGDYYFYTFTYTGLGSDSYMFVWHRTVIRHAS